ncbi:hypothetical protein GOP47_0020744 [Adiantum capillus-veneris]|uniref:3-oxo-5-alpha-steroid 4-dehydrogenase C-terminal domain-containing protein n=1 Tax=Adiantum capillus-veneris TaxID=13818 RepID=A0A9D4Z795_ADICA|nr:hypothetical protein GOP47_0020744 [Adiantum capillus-veneris]
MALLKVMEMIVAHPDPVGLRAVQVFNLVGAIRMVFAERRGESMPYSKFAQTDSIKGRIFSSRTGMAIIYSPAALVCACFLLTKLSSPAPDHRLVVFSTALTIHFIKRLLEVFFVHKYSGSMEMSLSFTISIFYALASAQQLYAQHFSVHQQPPSIDLMRFGMVLFLVGIVGNFYHHSLLAGLRKDDKDKDGKKWYVIPQGGLFTWVVCPHYLFESIGFLGIALIGQTTTTFVNAFATFITLAARSESTKRWYEKKIEGFPKERRAFVPFLF